MNETHEDPKNLTERFVEALSLETQNGGLQWHFEKGQGTPAHCICGGRRLTLVPSLADPNIDEYKLFSEDIESGESCLLMGSQSTLGAPNELRDLYQSIAEAISARDDEPAIVHMEIFIRKSSERQCLYSIIDAIKLLHRMISSNLKDIY